MKNIVFVIESLHLGGAEKSLVTLLQSIDYAKYNVDLILFTSEGIFLNQVPEQVKIIQIQWPYFSVFKRIQYKFLRILKHLSLHDSQILWSLIEDKNIYLKYLVRIINVEKSLAYNFKQFSDLKLKYISNVTLFFILSSNLNLKDKIKVVIAMMRFV